MAQPPRGAPAQPQEGQSGGTRMVLTWGPSRHSQQSSANLYSPSTHSRLPQLAGELQRCRGDVGGLAAATSPSAPSAKITGKEGSSIGGRNPACTAGARECWRLHLLCTLPPSQANPSTRAPLQHGCSERGRVAGALILHPLVKNFSINVPTATVT